jgi:hypothetical protein
MSQVTLVSRSDSPLKPLVESALRSEMRMLEIGLKRTDAPNLAAVLDEIRGLLPRDLIAISKG